MLPSTSWTSIADQFLARNSNIQDSVLAKQSYLDEARQIGSLILKNPPPWFKDEAYLSDSGSYGIRNYLFYQQQSNNIDDTLKYDTDVLFEYFIYSTHRSVIPYKKRNTCKNR